MTRKPRGKCPVTHIAIDTETTGLDFKRGVKPFAVSLCTQSGDAYFYSGVVNPTTRDVTWNPRDIAAIQRLLKAHDKIVMHNASFDVKSLATIGIDLTLEWDRIEDTMLASHALDSRESHGLKQLAKKYLGIPDDDQKLLKEHINKARAQARNRNELKVCDYINISEESMHDSWLPSYLSPKDKSLERYATLDAERTLLLWVKVLAPQLVNDGLWNQYKKNMRILPVVHHIEDHGVTVHPRTIKSEMNRIGAIRESAAQIALSLVPEDVCSNLASGKQLGIALYDYFRAPLLYRTESGQPATDAKTLVEVRSKLKPKTNAYKFISAVLKAAQAKTALQYLDNYERHKITIEGISYLFPSLNPTGTATTRFSGSNPNPQNVGKGKEVDEETKEVDYKLRINFGPQKGRIWYALDYDQLQLRIFAKASGEQRMIQAFADGYDFHTWMGCEIFQVAPDQLTKLQRRVAKNVNFGYIFGAGPRRIEESSGVTGLSAKLAKMFPIVTEYMKSTISFVKARGHVFTLGGYRLAVDKSKAYSGVCIVVQGTEGEIVKDAMVRVHERIKPHGDDFYMTLQVHDELIFDATTKTLKQHHEMLRGIKADMEAASLGVGVTTIANCEVSNKNWAESTKVKL